MMLHAYENGYYTLGRQTLLVPIEWTDDGWPRVPEGIRIDEPLRKPLGEAVPHGTGSLR
jgi:beta-xylosidase